MSVVKRNITAVCNKLAKAPNQECQSLIFEKCAQPILKIEIITVLVQISSPPPIICLKHRHISSTAITFYLPPEATGNKLLEISKLRFLILYLVIKLQVLKNDGRHSKPSQHLPRVQTNDVTTLFGHWVAAVSPYSEHKHLTCCYYHENRQRDRLSQLSVFVFSKVVKGRAEPICKRDNYPT